MANRRNSTHARRICWNTHRTMHALTGVQVMICWKCKTYIDPVRDQWRADHIRRHAEDGAETAENLWPICLSCDTGPNGKAAHDAREIAKGKRMMDSVFNLRTPRGPALPGSKRSNYKRTVDGRVFDRRTGAEIGGRRP